MARPKMTDKQKKEAKAKRDVEKASGAAKPVKAAPAEKKPRATVVFNSELDQEEKALFLNHHLPAIRAMRAKVAKDTADLRNAYKKAKAEGNFTKADFDTAFAVETAENEARERAKIARQLRIAKIMGSSLGSQLEFFLEPDRTPAVDIAFQEGENDAIQNKKASPKYDPSTEQARSYLEGYHSVSEKRIKEGIGKLDPEAAKAAEKETKAKVKVDTQKLEDEAAFDDDGAPKSGVPMTRAQFKAMQDASKGKPN